MISKKATPVARYRSYLETTTDEYLKIDFAVLKRLKMLDYEGWQKLYWNKNGKQIGSIGVKKEIEETFPILRTRCNYGGSRPWFRCLSCNDRVRILYGGTYFRCRNCYRLKYKSQYEEKMYRPLSAAQSLCKRLGGSANMDEMFPVKLKGMHWKTYYRLKPHHDHFEDIANSGFFDFLKKRHGASLNPPLI